MVPRSVGWRDASTFTGFCARHDSQTFAPLETTRFCGTDEQCFLIGYRALCHEVYEKKGFLRAGPVVLDLVDRGRPLEIQAELHRKYALMDSGARKGLDSFLRLKDLMDRQLLVAEYSGWSRVIVQFRGDLCVVSTGAVSPNRNMENEKLQVLHDVDADQETLLFGVVTTTEGGAVVLTWPTPQLAPRKFLESLLAKGEARLPSMLVQFMFAYVGNTYFSEDWWSSLPDEDRRHLTDLATMSNAYYTDFLYAPSLIVPWQVSGVIRVAA